MFKFDPFYNIEYYMKRVRFNKRIAFLKIVNLILELSPKTGIKSSNQN